MYILSVLDVCKNVAFLKIFMYVQIMLKTIFIVVPIGLIIMVSIDFAKNVIAGEDSDLSKNKKIAIQRIIMTIFLFAIPYIVSAFMRIMTGIDNSWLTCYEDLKGLDKSQINAIAIVNMEDLMMDLTAKDEITANDLRTMNRYLGYIEDESTKKKYEVEVEKIREIYNKQLADKASKFKEEPKSPSNPGGGSTGNGKILLVAGHSYPTYCNKAPNECRGKEASGYAEEDLTRELVLKIKSELLKIGYSNSDVDIANELLGEDMSNSKNTSRSLYVEKVQNTQVYNSINWGNYKYALEIHFNAYNTKARGIETLSITCSSSNKTKELDNNIRKEVSSLLNTTNRGCVARNSDNGNGIATINLFNRLGVPFTYIETEFYDNKSAIENYISKNNDVAKIIATNIKKYYP